MKSMSKFACSSIALGAIVMTLTACEPYPHRYGPGPGPDMYGPPSDAEYYDGAPGPDYQSSYYEDPCDSDSSYCSYGYYEGPVWLAGTWFGGPHRWRNGDHGREYYVHGGWHNDARPAKGGNWHGPGHYEHSHP